MALHLVFQAGMGTSTCTFIAATRVGARTPVAAWKMRIVAFFMRSIL